MHRFCRRSQTAAPHPCSFATLTAPTRTSPIAIAIIIIAATLFIPPAVSITISRPYPRGASTITTSLYELCATPRDDEVCSAIAASRRSTGAEVPASASVVRVWTLPIFSFDNHSSPSSPSWAITCNIRMPALAFGPGAFADGTSDITFDCDFGVPSVNPTSGLALAVTLQGLINSASHPARSVFKFRTSMFCVAVCSAALHHSHSISIIHIFISVHFELRTADVSPRLHRSHPRRQR